MAKLARPTDEPGQKGWSSELVSSVGYVVSSIRSTGGVVSVKLYEDMSLTRPSKQCKSLIDVLIQRQYLEKETIVAEEMNNGEGKYLFVEKTKKRGEGKGGEYLVKENIWSMEEKKTGEGKRGITWRRKINGDANQPTNKSTDQPGNIVQFSNVR